MDILLIIIDDVTHQQINGLPELKSITSKHHVTVMTSPVRAQDIYRECRYKRFKGIHIAAHADLEQIHLDDGDILKAEDLTQLARMSEATFLFLNACNTNMLASNATDHGLPYAIYTNVEIDDVVEAWKMPTAFYGYLQNGKAEDIPGAYAAATSGNGRYGLSINTRLVMELNSKIKKLETEIEELHVKTNSAIKITRNVAIVLSITSIITTTALTLLINILSGKLP